MCTHIYAEEFSPVRSGADDKELYDRSLKTMTEMHKSAS